VGPRYKTLHHSLTDDVPEAFSSANAHRDAYGIQVDIQARENGCTRESLCDTDFN
jgi:hypothetical protein